MIVLWRATAHSFPLCCHAYDTLYSFVLFSLVGLTGSAQTAQSIFEYLSFVLIPMVNKSLVLIVENGRCFMDLLCVFRCSFQKHFKNGEPGQLVIFVMQRFDINCHLLWKPFQFFSHSFQAGRTTIGRCVLVLCAH